jgi:hypothetical protein
VAVFYSQIRVFPPDYQLPLEKLAPRAGNGTKARPSMHKEFFVPIFNGL